MSGLPNPFSPPHGDALLKPGHDYELRGSEIVVAGNTRGVMSNDKMREAYAALRRGLRTILWRNDFWLNNPGVGDDEILSAVNRLMDERAALADSADAEKNVTNVADGVVAARINEAGVPIMPEADSADAPPEPTEEMVEAIKAHELRLIHLLMAVVDVDEDAIEATRLALVTSRDELVAALAVAQKER